MTDLKEVVNMKKTCGGIFVLLQIAVSVFYCFEGLIFSFEQPIGIGSIISIWIYFLATITVYGLGKLVVTTQDFSIVAGYDPKKNYNKAEVTGMMQYITTVACFIGMVYAALHLIIPFIGNSAERELFSGILTAGYVISITVDIFVFNAKYKDRIIINETKET